MNAFEKKADWSDPELMKFLDEDTFRREFRDWKYMDVELEAERLLRKLKGSTNFGERACKGGHECSVQVLLQKYRKQKDYDPANILFQNRDNWTRTWHPLGTLREIDNLQLASKCSLGASLSGIISFS